jgi:hypothetical protein
VLPDAPVPALFEPSTSVPPAPPARPRQAGLGRVPACASADRGLKDTDARLAGLSELASLGKAGAGPDLLAAFGAADPALRERAAVLPGTSGGGRLACPARGVETEKSPEVRGPVRAAGMLGDARTVPWVVARRGRAADDLGADGLARLRTPAALRCLPTDSRRPSPRRRPTRPAPGCSPICGARRSRPRSGPSAACRAAAGRGGPAPGPAPTGPAAPARDRDEASVAPVGSPPPCGFRARGARSRIRLADPSRPPGRRAPRPPRPRARTAAAGRRELGCACSTPSPSGGPATSRSRPAPSTP